LLRARRILEVRGAWVGVRLSENLKHTGHRDHGVIPDAFTVC
jgi:hypothetical protein